MTITAEIKPHNYLTHKNRQCITCGIFYCQVVPKSTVVARFKLHRGLTVTCSEIGNKTYRHRCGAYKEQVVLAVFSN